MSSSDPFQFPVTTTTPDDVFYILKSVIMRLISTGCSYGFQRTMQQLREIVDRDYIGVIKGKLDEVYKNAGAVASNTRPDRVERENRVTFIVSPCQSLDFIRCLILR